MFGSRPEEYFSPLQTAQKESRTERRQTQMRKGDDTLTMEQVYPTELEEGDVVSFLYQAKQSGTKGKNIYFADDDIFDYQPLGVLLSLKRMKTGIVMTLLNIHYIPTKVIRGKLILDHRRGRSIPRQAFNRMVHAYNIERIESPLFRARNLTADSELLFSSPDWRRLKK